MFVYRIRKKSQFDELFSHKKSYFMSTKNDRYCLENGGLMIVNTNLIDGAINPFSPQHKCETVVLRGDEVEGTKLKDAGSSVLRELPEKEYSREVDYFAPMKKEVRIALDLGKYFFDDVANDKEEEKQILDDGWVDEALLNADTNELIFKRVLEFSKMHSLL